jgi:hypothetical protein
MQYQYKIINQKKCLVTCALNYLFDDELSNSITIDGNSKLPDKSCFTRDMTPLYNLLIPKHGTVRMVELLPSLTHITYSDPFEMQNVITALQWLSKDKNVVTELNLKLYSIRVSYQDVSYNQNDKKINKHKVSLIFPSAAFEDDSTSLFQYSLEKSEGATLYDDEPGYCRIEFWHNGIIDGECSAKIERISQKIHQFRFGGYLKEFNILDYVVK